MKPRKMRRTLFDIYVHLFMVVVFLLSLGNTVFLTRSEILSLTRARQDPVRVDPKHYAVEFETDKVRVLRIKHGPGEKSVMHGHPAMVGVFLTDGKVRFAYPNGKVEDIK